MIKRTILGFVVVFLCTFFACGFFVGRKAEAGYLGELLSEYSTDYSFSSEGRAHNVELASKKINGTVIKPGEIFSFNFVTGKRTIENGYQNSPTIENGKYTVGVGGGVCQVSTTLYNAVIRAGLKIISVSPHSLPVSYVPLSMDAMVSEATDFRFINNTPYPITIKSETKKSVLKFKLYGYKTITDGEEIRYVSRIVKRIPASYEEEVDLQGIVGEEEFKIIKKAKEGFISECWKEVYYQGKLMESERIRKDYYAPQDGVKLIKPEEEKQDVNSIA